MRMIGEVWVRPDGRHVVTVETSMFDFAKFYMNGYRLAKYRVRVTPKKCECEDCRAARDRLN